LRVPTPLEITEHQGETPKKSVGRYRHQSKLSEVVKSIEKLGLVKSEFGD